ncbi:MAG: YajG family lipoprotein [Lentisphaerota bacterium]
MIKRDMVRFRNCILIGCAAFSIAVLSGCAFGDRVVCVTPVIAETCPETTVHTEIKVLAPEDSRGKKANFVAYVRNGFRMHTADVLADKTVQQWVQDTLIANLKKAGYNPIAGGDKNIDGISISTKISKLECDVGVQYDSSITITVTVQKDNVTAFQDTYHGEAKQPGFWMNSAEYQDVLQKTMQNCVNNMMPDLLRKLEKVSAEYVSEKETENSSKVINDSSKAEKNKNNAVNKTNAEKDNYF